jgi:hypothetical protein
VTVAPSGHSLAVTVGAGGPNGEWFGNPATRGGRGEPSRVSNAGSLLIESDGGTGGIYCAGGRRTGTRPGQTVCAGTPAGQGGLAGDCFTSGTEGCFGTDGAVSITW